MTSDPATKIHDAVAQGNLASVQALLDEDEDLLNALNNDKQTPIMIAAKHGEATVGSILAECGADLQAQDAEGNTALHYSCLHNNRLVTSMLLWGGSERDVQNGAGDTALHVAARVGAHDSAWLLLENGGEKSKEIKNQKGECPLDIAVTSGNEQLIELLKADG
ncbi:unnamed protein product [Amoebophrya sp. A120]|nr:unnamed protein product [Amoebophrya sp. A120]|eukprot:GSA120T00021708001.1